MKRKSHRIFTCKIKHIPTKRIFDLIFSSIVITLCLPIYFFIGFLIKMTSKGNAIYSQKRIGRGGTSFNCYKFRTMYEDADNKLEELLATNSQLKQEWIDQRKLKNDPRITPIGKFLRKTSLDELPQFFNVIKGDLSIVGPRPVVAEELAQHFGMKAGKILSIRPGITGIWQTSGRSDTSYATRIQLDEKYVDNRTITLDLKLIAKTIPKMINTKGAY